MKASELKASELRIGNFLRAKKDYHNQFHGNGIVSSIEQSKFVILDHYPGKWFEPIPLTEEWLLKFGFKWKGLIAKGRYLTLFTPCGKAIVYKESHFIFTGVTIEVQTNYLHQLQNLYFALTGEELILKP
jgi:hypothetical protein